MSARWTAARIRRAIAHPKPQGAIAAYRAGMTGRPRAARPDELALLRYIAETADLLDVGPSDHGVAWLLVPMPSRMLDALAEFEAELHDLEGDEREPDADDEPDHDREKIENEDGPDQGFDPEANILLHRHGPMLEGVPVVQIGGYRATHHVDLSQWRRVE